MTNEQLLEFKNKFIDMLDELTNDEIEWSGDLGSGDSVDKLNNERDTIIRLKLEGRKRLLFIKIQEALERIENGTFGICEECGEEISIERLKARPMATLCVNCKEIEEQAENQIRYEKRSHTCGRTFVNDYNNVSIAL